MFSEAALGYNPSATWKSIMEAKFIINAGCRWQEGDGTNIRAWLDAWLPRPIHFCMVTPRLLNCEDITVNEFILPNSQAWDTAKLQAHFCDVDIACITVKTVYLVAEHEQQRSSAFLAESTNLHKKANWGFLWRTKLSGKLKYFAWHLGRRTLPVRINLHRHHLEVEDLCPICQSVAEIEEHIFLRCDFAHQCWVLADIQGHTHPSGATLQRIGYEMAVKCTSDEFTLALAIIWSIWAHPNKLIFEGFQQPPAAMVHFARAYLKKYKQSLLRLCPSLEQP
ncbi:UNVERIFIED_CONTAM: hypothetical protein Slati_0229500 [Sesamum latifolium]|uniref:Reverse transcriptase zinc-binding domain-containing protein n=1 Tax=Sesamum latifolium TaxID=2727402 RepID=A0AAW2YCI9_9LAMI